MVAFTSGTLFVMFAGSKAPPDVGPFTFALLMTGFLALFWAVGVGLLLASINMGRRRAIIDVVGGTLLISQPSPFGTLQREWSAEQIDRVVTGPSNMKVNNVPVIELQVHPRTGKKFGCLSQVNDAELHWLAAEINQALGLKTYDANAPTTIPQARWDSRIIID